MRVVTSHVHVKLYTKFRGEIERNPTFTLFLRCFLSFSSLAEIFVRRRVTNSRFYVYMFIYFS